MNFRKMLEDKLKPIPRFNNALCIEEKEKAEFFGYRIANIFAGSEKETVTAGLVVEDGAIVGVGYYAGPEFHKTEFVGERYLSELDKCLDSLVESLDCNRDIGCESWIKLRFETRTNALITSANDLVNDNGKMFRINSVLVDTGFASAFATLFFCSVNNQMVASIASTQKVYGSDGDETCISKYECVFDDKKKGNALYSKVLDSMFVSKKGNRVYKLNKDDFISNFHTVDGDKFLIKGER